jgi:hypothetical protein
MKYYTAYTEASKESNVSIFRVKRQMMWIIDRFTLKMETLRSNNLSVTLANDQLDAQIF